MRGFKCFFLGLMMIKASLAGNELSSSFDTPSSEGYRFSRQNKDEQLYIYDYSSERSLIAGHGAGKSGGDWRVENSRLAQRRYARRSTVSLHGEVQPRLADGNLVTKNSCCGPTGIDHAPSRNKRGHSQPKDSQINPSVVARTHATWDDYANVPKYSSSAAFIGERDPLKEFEKKGMLRRCNSRFIIKPSLDVQKGWGNNPKVKGLVERVINRLWEDKPLRKKEFRSLQNALKVELKKCEDDSLSSYADLPSSASAKLSPFENQKDFLILLLRLVERKRGHNIVVEMHDL